MARRVLVAGETLVDFLPDKPGSLAAVDSFSRQAGGAPANVAVGLARLEQTPWFCTTLAGDSFGEYLAGVLNREGIPDRFVSREPTTQTALAFVSHNQDADREFTFYRKGTADRQFDTSIIPDTTLKSVDIVVIGGVTLTVEPARSATFDLVERAQNMDCQVLFDPNVRDELWEVDAERTMQRMLSLTDVLKCSQDDLGGRALTAEVNELLDSGPEALFMTKGDDGASLIADTASLWGHGTWHHDGYQVDDVADTTGAGDAFTAGVVTGLLDKGAPEDILGFANAVAAASTRSEGAMTALPDREATRRVRVGDC